MSRESARGGSTGNAENPVGGALSTFLVNTCKCLVNEPGPGGVGGKSDVAPGSAVMTGRVHILRVRNRYRLVFVPSGPGRHLVEGEDALRNFLLTDLEIPPDVTETAIGELDRGGRHTIENILVTDRTRTFWPLDTTPPPTAPEAKSTAPALSKPATRKPRRVVARRTRAKPKPARKTKRKGRSGR